MASIASAFAIGISTANDVHLPVSADLRLDVTMRIKRWLRRGDTVEVLPEDHIIVELRGAVTPALLSRLRRIMRAIVELPFYSDGDLRHLDVGTSWVPLTGNRDVDDQRRAHILTEADQALLNRDLDLRPGDAAAVA